MATKKQMRALRPCAIALLIAGSALTARHLAQPLLGHEAPYVFFTMAAVLTTWLAGIVPGIAVMIAGYVCGDYFFTPPVHQFGPYSLKEQAYIADFVLGSGAGIALIALLRKSERQLKRTARDLATEIEVRKQAERELKSAKQKLEAAVSDRTVALRQSVTSMEELLYAMVHNLRAPGRAMEGLAQIITETCRTNIAPSAYGLLDRLSAAARKNDSLIEDLLEYGRVSHVELRRQEVSCKALLSRVMSDLDAEIAAAGAYIMVERGSDTFVADENAMLTIFRELISNALKFRRAEGLPVVRVRTERSSETLRVYVEDNGVGIEEAYAGKIFRLFEKVESESDGNGIGLAIVSKLVERLGGTIDVSSRPGAGTAFILQMPVGTQEPKTSEMQVVDEVLVGGA